jgi:hypothetical protein
MYPDVVKEAWALLRRARGCQDPSDLTLVWGSSEAAGVSTGSYGKKWSMEEKKETVDEREERAKVGGVGRSVVLDYMY